LVTAVEPDQVSSCGTVVMKLKVALVATVPLVYYSSGGHRELHSFPTRRSSDLTGALTPARFKHTDAVFNVGLAVAAVQVAAPGVDRKSTRLNSSHVKISYAVFCLKKKNTRLSRLGPTTRRMADREQGSRARKVT